jgi:hypothetical protein
MVIHARLGLDLWMIVFVVVVERVDVCLRQFVTGLVDVWLKPINNNKIVVCSTVRSFVDRLTLHKVVSCNSS